MKDTKIAALEDIIKLAKAKEDGLSEVLNQRMNIKGTGAMGASTMEDVASKLKGVASVDDLASRPINTGSRIANKMEQRLLKDAASEIAERSAKKGLGSMLGRAASIAAGPVGMLISEGADASELATAPQDRAIESPYYRKMQALDDMRKRADQRAEMARQKNTDQDLDKVMKEVMEVEDRLGANDWEEPKKEKISNVEAIRYMLENMK